MRQNSNEKKTLFSNCSSTKLIFEIAVLLLRLSLSRVHTWNNRGSNSDMAARNSARIQSYVRGYHVYKRMWTPFIGEMATTTIENANLHDRYAIAVLESETLCCVGHVPREISRDCLFYSNRRHR